MSQEHQAPLISDFADDADMVELVEMFVGELPERVEAIRSATEQGDLATLASLSHQLKGAAGGYGFTPITDAAFTVEQQAKAAEDLDNLRQSVDDLLDLCQRAKASA